MASPATPLRGTSGSVVLGSIANVNIRAWSATPSQQLVDVTSFDSGGWAETVGTLKSLSGTASGQMDAAKVSIATALTSTPVAITLGLSGTITYTGSAVVGAVNVTQVVEGVATVSFPFQSSGSWS